MRREYLMCPVCLRQRVTRREFSDGNGYACDWCDFSAYIEEEGDQHLLRDLQAENRHVTIQFKYYGRLA
jgi:hypothetical protein